MSSYTSGNDLVFIIEVKYFLRSLLDKLNLHSSHIILEGPTV